MREVTYVERQSLREFGMSLPSHWRRRRILLGLRLCVSVSSASSGASMAEINEPLRLVAFEYRGRMKGGRGKPPLLACVDESGNETQVVLKLRSRTSDEGSFGPCSLACELICSILARAAGLVVPDYAIVEIDQDFVGSVTDSEDRARLQADLGENFGSVYQEDCAKFSPGMRMAKERQGELESILAFDDYVLNNDRKASNPNLLIRGDNLFLIDHSLCFPHLASPAIQEPWREFLPDESIREHCIYQSLRQLKPDFEVFSTFVARELTDADIRVVLSLVPEGWQRLDPRPISMEARERAHDPTSSDKDSILQYLLR